MGVAIFRTNRGDNAILLKHKKISALFLSFMLLYLAPIVLIAPEHTVLVKYHISALQAALLGLTVTIPYIAIWYIALIGYLRLKTYTEMIDESKDGKAFSVITRGILIFALWLPLTALISSAITYIHRTHPSLIAHAVRFDNYANLLILFAAYVFVYVGSEQLRGLIKRQQLTAKQGIWFAVFAGLAVIYIFLALNDPSRQAPTYDIPVATYYLPDWLIVSTIIIPRLIMWYLGIRAVQNIYSYRHKVKGLIYRDALKNLATGLAFIVCSTITLRYFQSLSNPLSHLRLAILLTLIYGIVIMIGIGYALVARGAKKLQLIEES